MKTLCIWHGNCQDGFGAAWAVRYALGEDNVEFYPGVYQDAPPDVAGRDVLMVDFSYKRPVLDQMAQVAKSIVILDHHKTAEVDLEPFTVQLCGGARFSWADVPGILGDFAELGRPPILAHFDMNRSGAGIAWDAFHLRSPRPRLIDHIEDRDLWRFALPKTREIAAALFSYPYDFGLWDSLMSDDMLTHLAVEGGAIERKHHQDIANLLPVVQRQMTIGGIMMPVACLPITLTSDAGHKMAVESGVGAAACYWDTPEGRVFSLRSTDDGPDVSAIAKTYGGGGHAHAAGFRVALSCLGGRCGMIPHPALGAVAFVLIGAASYDPQTLHLLHADGYVEDVPATSAPICAGWSRRVDLLLPTEHGEVLRAWCTPENSFTAQEGCIVGYSGGRAEGHCR